MAGGGGGAVDVAVFAGPSGGHLFPAYAFAQAVRRRAGGRIVLVTGRKAAGLVAGWTAGVFDEIFFLPDFPFPRGISFRLPLFLLQFVRAFILSAVILKKTRPDVCAGFGSYVSYPGILLSSWLGLPTLIHEQNAIPGKATEWLAGRADCVAVSFPRTPFSKKVREQVYTGLPVRAELVEAARSARPARQGGSKTLLIAGGSQGAHRINQAALDAFGRMADEEKAKIAVIHITGKADFDSVRDSYGRLGIRHQVYPFYAKMQELYPRADFMLARAGANTLFELMLFRIPAVVVPYPFAESHQLANARYFEHEKILTCRRESELDGGWLAGQFRAVLSGAAAGFSSGPGPATPHTDAAENLAALAESLISRSRK